MSLAQTTSVALLGLDGHLVTVEVDIADGVPMYSLLGLPDTALSESRERVRAAMVNCAEKWPNKKAYSAETAANALHLQRHQQQQQQQAPQKTTPVEKQRHLE